MRYPGTDTRERILDAAIPAFAERGFAGASTRELAGACSVNVATLNYHFGSKEALYAACVERVYEELTREAAALGPTAVSMSVETAMRAVWRAARMQQDGIRLLMREVLDEGGLRDRTTREHFLPFLSSTAQAVSATLGTDPARARELIATLGFLIARFAVQSDASLLAIFGVSDVSAAEERVVACLLSTLHGFVSLPS